MKNMKKLIPALAMLVLSAVMMSTASFAWFSMNTEVEVTDLTVNAVAPVYVSISARDAGTWGTAVDYDDAQINSLVPVDTDKDLTNWFAINPKKFQSTTGGGILTGEASVESANVVESTDGTVTFDGGSPLTAYIHKEYDFTLQNEVAETIMLYLNAISVDNVDKGMLKCLRVAVVDVTSTEKVLGIYAFGDGTDTHTPIVEDTGVYKATGEAVDTVSGSVTDNKTEYAYNENNAVEVPVLGDGSGIVKLDVYVWFEGQDANCVNASADGKFTIAFTFGTEEKA